MSAPDQGEGISKVYETSTDLFDLLNELGERNSQLLAACGTYSEDPGADSAKETLEDAKDEVLDSFSRCIKMMFVEGDYETARDIAGLMSRTETSRIEGLKLLVPELKLKPIDEEMMLKSVRHSFSRAESVDDFINDVLDDFANTLFADVKAFTKMLRKEFRKYKASRMLIEIAAEPFEVDDRSEEPTTGFSFSIQPPLKAVHDPEFIPHTYLSFTDKNATYGQTWVSHEVTQDIEGEEEKADAILLHFNDRFMKALNPLGYAAMEVAWGQTSEDMPSDDEENSED